MKRPYTKLTTESFLSTLGQLISWREYYRNHRALFIVPIQARVIDDDRNSADLSHALRLDYLIAPYLERLIDYSSAKDAAVEDFIAQILSSEFRV